MEKNQEPCKPLGRPPPASGRLLVVPPAGWLSGLRPSAAAGCPGFPCSFCPFPLSPRTRQWAQRDSNVEPTATEIVRRV